MDAVDSMSTVILTCQIYAQRFLKIPSSKLNKSDSDLREEIKQAIIELYKIVLKLSYQAKKYSERSLGKIGKVRLSPSIDYYSFSLYQGGSSGGCLATIPISLAQ